MVPKAVGEESAIQEVPVLPDNVGEESAVQEGTQVPKNISEAKSDSVLHVCVPDVSAEEADSDSDRVAATRWEHSETRVAKVVRGSFH